MVFKMFGRIKHSKFEKWGCPDLNRGRQVPNLKGYQATPQPLDKKQLKIIYKLFPLEKSRIIFFLRVLQSVL